MISCSIRPKTLSQKHPLQAPSSAKCCGALCAEQLRNKKRILSEVLSFPDKNVSSAMMLVCFSVRLLVRVKWNACRTATVQQWLSYTASAAPDIIAMVTEGEVTMTTDQWQPRTGIYFRWWSGVAGRPALHGNSRVSDFSKLPGLRKYCGFSMTGIFVIPIITASGPISEDDGVLLPLETWWSGLAESSSLLMTDEDPDGERKISQTMQESIQNRILLLGH